MLTTHAKCDRTRQIETGIVFSKLKKKYKIIKKEKNV